MAEVAELTVDVHVSVDGKPSAFWKLRLLARVASLLGIKLKLEAL